MTNLRRLESKTFGILDVFTWVECDASRVPALSRFQGLVARTRLFFVWQDPGSYGARTSSEIIRLGGTHILVSTHCSRSAQEMKAQSLRIDGKDSLSLKGSLESCWALLDFCRSFSGGAGEGEVDDDNDGGGGRESRIRTGRRGTRSDGSSEGGSIRPIFLSSSSLKLKG